jgi:hypothetical protein
MMRQLLEKLPERIRLPTLTAIYGVLSGLGAVAFMFTVNKLYTLVWHRLAAQGALDFAFASLVVIVLSSAAITE